MRSDVSLNRPIANIDPLGYANTTIYDSDGRMQASIDALGRYSTMLYDPAGRMVASVDALGHFSTTSYDIAGRRIASIDALGFATSTVYDAANRVIANINALGYRTSFGYDAAGRRVRVQDALGAVTSNLYDAGSRLIAQVNSLGYITSNIYDAAGRQVAGVDANGFATSFSFDAVGRNTAQQNALGYRTSFAYDPLGQRIAVIDANSHATSSIYDSRGDLLVTQDALGRRTSLSYDAVRNQVLKIDGRGWNTTSTYDALNRLIANAFQDGTRTTFGYDQLGQRVFMADVTGLTTTTYDELGRVQMVQYPLLAPMSYVYDANDNRVSLLDAKGGTTNYAYDRRNALAGIANPWNELTTISYDANGRELRRDIANGMATVRNYDPAGRESGHYTSPGGSPTGPMAGCFTVTRDAVGNVTGVVELDGAVTFAYDRSYQLVNENRSGIASTNVTHAYDPVGNRLVRQENGALSTFAYDRANQITGDQTPDGSHNYDFDAAGNMTGQTSYDLAHTVTATSTLSYDGENRLVQQVGVTGPTKTQLFEYDGDGKRRIVIDGMKQRLAVWDEDNVLQELDLGNTLLPLLAHYTDNPGYWGGLTSQRVLIPAGGSRFNSPRFNSTSFNEADDDGLSSMFYGFDLSGNTRYLLDAAGSVSSQYVADAFGFELFKSGSDPNRYWFGGQVGYSRDGMNRYYVRNRTYWAELIRWLTMDPIGFDGGLWNLYGYVGNDPVGKNDPFGLNPVVIIGGVAVGAEELAAAAAALGMSISECLASPECKDLAIKNTQAVGQFIVTLGTAGVQIIQELSRLCKKVRCKVASHKADHWWYEPVVAVPPIQRCFRYHVQLNCWIVGGGKIAEIRIPYGPCCRYKNCAGGTTITMVNMIDNLEQP